MIREIVKDETFLAQKSEPATEEDIQIAIDLLDTLKANKEGCVGLAANMIGELKNIIAVDDFGTLMVMINPKISKAAGKKYKAEEGCLSLEGKRVTYRHEIIQVKYKDMEFKTQIRSFSGLTAEIVQHEIDHCNGKII